MTKTAKFMTASTAALLIGAAPALAVPQSVIDSIVAELSAQGFQRIEIDIERNEIDVDAYGAGFEGDFTYSRDGQLLDSDIDEYADDDSGRWNSDDSYDDDDDDDDDYDDDDYRDDDDDDSSYDDDDDDYDDDDDGDYGDDSSDDSGDYDDDDDDYDDD
ncbi:hypothetical protein [Rhodophyticola sp.]|jgi:hypothetical protein|uniref:hypothetical protein n=1 Tax=Rhodophyticola sp. TaxID=2680032 RepID=UPI003D2753A3